MLYQVNGASKKSESIRPLYFLSRSLHDVETRHDARKLELLAVKWVLARFRSWGIAPHLTIVTNHESLTTIMQGFESNPTINRWAAEIAEYAPNFHYHPGATNHMADFLSRHPFLVEEKPNGDSIQQYKRVNAFRLAVARSVESTPSPVNHVSKTE